MREAMQFFLLVLPYNLLLFFALLFIVFALLELKVVDGVTFGVCG